MTKFEEELSNLPVSIITNYGDYWNKSQLLTVFKDWQPQQALPVVPEDVDEAIKYLKKHVDSTFIELGDILTGKGFKWLNDFQFKDRRFGFGGLNNKLFILSHLAITGYEVEKPQLFYLKHIDMSKLDETHDWFILHHGSLGHSPFCKGELPYYCNNAKFTQQEIDSMQTGSYEQIEVEK